MVEVKFYDNLNDKSMWDEIADAVGCERFNPEKPWPYLIGKFEICEEAINDYWYPGRTISCEKRRIGDLTTWLGDKELAFLGKRMMAALNYFEGVVTIPPPPVR